MDDHPAAPGTCCLLGSHSSPVQLWMVALQADHGKTPSAARVSHAATVNTPTGGTAILGPSSDERINRTVGAFGR